MSGEEYTDVCVRWEAKGSATDDAIYPYIYITTVRGGENSVAVNSLKYNLVRFASLSGAVGAVKAATGPSGSFDDLITNNVAACMRAVRTVYSAEELIDIVR